eukprot:1364604-Prymnesium_polylepis.1
MQTFCAALFGEQHRQETATLPRRRAYFDVDNVFFAGESAGGAMALYAATCARERGLDSVRSFAVHSSGIKVKGDGLKWEK